MILRLVCSGLVLDVVNKAAVATPFPKFFNYGFALHLSDVTIVLASEVALPAQRLPELRLDAKSKPVVEEKEQKTAAVTGEPVVVSADADPAFTSTEKMDGSLGIIFFFNGSWRVATRGPFALLVYRVHAVVRLV